MQCLTPEFRDALRLRLSAQPKTELDKASHAYLLGPIEGRFKYTDVLDHADVLAREHAGTASRLSADGAKPGLIPFRNLGGGTVPASPGKSAVKQEPSLTEFRLEFDQKHDELRDEMKTAFTQLHEESRRAHKDFGALKERLEILLDNPHNIVALQNSKIQVAGRNLPPAGSWRNERGNGGMPGANCFYCQKPGHFANSCQDKSRHLAAAKIYLRGNDVHLTATGQRVPQWGPDKPSISQRVESGGLGPQSVNFQEMTLEEYEDARNGHYAVNHQGVEQFATQSDIASLQDSVNGIQGQLSSFMAAVNQRGTLMQQGPPATPTKAATASDDAFREKFMEFASQFVNTRAAGPSTDFQ